jgi:hypothetical protein
MDIAGVNVSIPFAFADEPLFQQPDSGSRVDWGPGSLPRNCELHGGVNMKDLMRAHHFGRPLLLAGTVAECCS